MQKLKAENFELLLLNSKLCRQIVEACSFEQCCNLMRESVKFFNGKLFPYDFGTRLGMVDFCTSSILKRKHLGPTPHAFAYQVFHKGRESRQLDFDVIFNQMGINVKSYVGFKERQEFEVWITDRKRGGTYAIPFPFPGSHICYFRFPTFDVVKLSAFAKISFNGEPHFIARTNSLFDVPGNIE